MGVLQGTPGNPHSATSTPFSQRRWRRAVRRPGVRMHCNRGNLCAVVGSLFRADCRCRARTTGLEAATAACVPSHPRSWPFGPLHGRQAPPLGRQRAARRQTAAQRPSEALPNLRRHPEAPPEPLSARQRRSQCHTRHRWLPRDSPRLLPNLEQQSDTGAPATTWYSATPRTYPHIHSATTPPPRTPPPLPPPFFSSLRVAARYLPSYSSDRNSP